MALIMYLTKAPRYKNIMTDKYETLPMNDIVLIDKYFNWGKEREIGGKYSCDTLEEWCGVSESQLPHKYIVNYYRDFFTDKKVYSELTGESNKESICEHVARIVKANQIFGWFIRNVMNGNQDMEYYEVTKDKIESLLDVCKTVIHGDSLDKEKLLPIMEDGGFFFGVDSYNELYVNQVTDVVNILSNVLKTTDFETEAVYFNAKW